MAGTAPGFTCSTRYGSIDLGTTCTSATPSPTPVGTTPNPDRLPPVRHFGFLPHIPAVGPLLVLIRALPQDMKREPAYQFVSSFFDHYLPKKFLRQFIWGGGQPLKLTQQEMIDLNPNISVRNCPAFLKMLADSGGGRPASSMDLPLGATASTRAADGALTISSVDLRCPAGAMTNGTLGQFTAILHATVLIRNETDWELSGRMSFYDEWDFDPKDFDTSSWTFGGRPLPAEIKTEFANLVLPGEGFKITSVDVDFSQKTTDRTVVWAGGRPTQVLDKTGKVDVGLGDPRQK